MLASASAGHIFLKPPSGCGFLAIKRVKLNSKVLLYIDDFFQYRPVWFSVANVIWHSNIFFIMSKLDTFCFRLLRHSHSLS